MSPGKTAWSVLEAHGWVDGLGRVRQGGRAGGGARGRGGWFALVVFFGQEFGALRMRVREGRHWREEACVVQLGGVFRVRVW